MATIHAEKRAKAFQHALITVLLLISVFKHELLETILKLSNHGILGEIALLIAFILVYFLYEYFLEKYLHTSPFQHLLVLALLAVVIFKHELFEAFANSHDNQTIPNLLLLFSFFVIYFSLQYLDSLRLGARLFLGPNDITGIWIDVVFDERNKATSGAFIVINKDKDTFSIHGKEYFPSKKQGIEFRSSDVYYDNRRLSFTYDEDECSLSNTHYGQAKYRFSGEERCNQFRGCFINEKSNKVFTNIGQRLSTSLHQLNKKNLKTISRDVLLYYRKSLFRPLLRLFRLHQRPEITPEDAATLTSEVIKHIAKHYGLTL